MKNGRLWEYPGGYWVREAGGELKRSSAYYVTGLGIEFGFLWLLLNWKKRNKKRGGGGGRGWEASTHCPKPKCCGLITAKVVIWFPAWKLVGCCRFVGQDSVVIYDLHCLFVYPVCQV